MAQNKNTAAVREYAKQIAELREKRGAREHAYRPWLVKLLSALIPGADIINEGETGRDQPDLRAESESGAALGYLETKDVGADLDREQKSEQMARYRSNFSNLILTDYLEFRRYAGGEFVCAVCLADNGKLTLPLPQKRARELAEFLGAFAETGKSGKDESPSAEELAKTLAAKAKEIKKCAVAAMENGDSDLTALHDAFSENLIHRLTPERFSDIFAQTAVYALFTARLEADRRGKIKEFSRANAGEFLPQTTPLLRKFFNQFMQSDMDKNLETAAERAAAYLRAVHLDKIYHEFGKTNSDPFMYFYETFMSHYDGAARKKHGVYYTPPQVVDFIVRAVDFCVGEYFPETPDGLAAITKTKSARGKNKPALRRMVQILDPAAGTGTFLSKVTEIIKEKIAPASDNVWESYAAEELLPRLFGFENMAGAYAICHMKFAMDLGEKIMARLESKGKRVNMYLTDSLDYSKHSRMGIGWLADEAEAADRVKSETPVMVVLGNPPYNVRSKNSSEHITGLLKDYKAGLGERKINLDDDYIKFIRNAEWLVAEQTGRGIVAFITNNSFYGGITHRVMREHLLRSFDEIYILNLHGKMGETSLDGGADENVFNIQVGVGIIIMVKTSASKNPANVRYADCFGAREAKFDYLQDYNLETVEWKDLSPTTPNYFFVPKDFSGKKKYNKGILLTDLFAVYNSGIQTKRDSLTVQFTNDEDDEIAAVVEDMENMSAEEIREKYNLPPDGRDWRVEWAKKDVQSGGEVIPYTYRPFDERQTFYTGRTKGFIAYPRHKIMRHFIGHENVGLIAPRICKGQSGFQHGFVSKHVIDIAAGDAHSGSGTYFFPLWLFDETHGKIQRRANLRAEFAKKMADAAQMPYSESGGNNTVSPQQIFDYVYAVLHNPHFRQKYGEFLKIGFARIPLPKNRAAFLRAAQTGETLRQLHLITPRSPKGKTAFFGENKTIRKIAAKPETGGTLRVKINDTSGFSAVPETAWEFSVGGYSPAQKWLKSRKNKALKFADQQQFRQITHALTQTAKIMAEMGEV